MNRPPGSNWGHYGSADLLGRLNELTGERVRQAALEIRTGLRFCLSLPLDYPGGNALTSARHPPIRLPAIYHGHAATDLARSVLREGAPGVFNDDVVTLYPQYSTQWDALGHRGAMFDADGDGNAEIVYYNAHYPAPDVDAMATIGLQGRGVMVDLHRRYGNDRVVVTHAMLSEVMRDQNVTVEPGDVLCLHTGFAQLLLDWKKSPDPALVHNACAVLEGSDPQLHAWITESGIAALVADNHAVEVPAILQTPSTEQVRLHDLCLFKLGIPLGELWYLSELAAWLGQNARNRFFLTAPPLRLPGCAGSPVTPIATV